MMCGISKRIKRMLTVSRRARSQLASALVSAFAFADPQIAFGDICGRVGEIPRF
jgi:hypothetical protein